jgi:hypothetical protein
MILSQFDILKNINESNKTSLETFVSGQNISNDIFVSRFVYHYRDSNGFNRFTIYDRINKQIIAAILFDSNNVCLFRETALNHRLKGLQSNLWCYAAVVLGNIKHSDSLTEQGKKLIK